MTNKVKTLIAKKGNGELTVELVEGRFEGDPRQYEIVLKTSHPEDDCCIVLDSEAAEFIHNELRILTQMEDEQSYYRTQYSLP